MTFYMRALEQLSLLGSIIFFSFILKVWGLKQLVWTDEEEGTAKMCDEKEHLLAGVRDAHAALARAQSVVFSGRAGQSHLYRPADAARYCLVVVSNSKSLESVFMNNIEFAHTFAKLTLS